jgi:predicted  nucleic acid-binding Zn-ribbon protein
LKHLDNADPSTLEEIFDSFSLSYQRYWEAYIVLQNQLYETLRAAREVQWLAATDEKKLSEINSLQRELFSSVPRRLDYTPLGQISQDLDSAPNKIDELNTALSSVDEACKKLEEGVTTFKARAQTTKAALMAIRI